MDDTSTTMTQGDLLAHIRDSRAAFAAFWAGLGDAQMTQRPGPQPDWSVKDLMLHIAHWEGWMLDKVRSLLNNSQQPEIPDLDAENAEIFARYQDTALSDARAMWVEGLIKLQAVISKIPTEVLNDTSRFGSKTLLQHILDDTSEHYAEHTDELRSYADRL